MMLFKYDSHLVCSDWFDVRKPLGVALWECSLQQHSEQGRVSSMRRRVTSVSFWSYLWPWSLVHVEVWDVFWWRVPLQRFNLGPALAKVLLLPAAYFSSPLLRVVWCTFVPSLLVNALRLPSRWFFGGYVKEPLGSVPPVGCKALDLFICFLMSTCRWTRLDCHHM